MNIGKIPAKTASLSPHREALVDIPNDRRMTYGELDRRAGGWLAHRSELLEKLLWSDDYRVGAIHRLSGSDGAGGDD